MAKANRIVVWMMLCVVIVAMNAKDGEALCYPICYDDCIKENNFLKCAAKCGLWCTGRSVEFYQKPGVAEAPEAQQTIDELRQGELPPKGISIPPDVQPLVNYMEEDEQEQEQEQKQEEKTGVSKKTT
uniref:Uncharacterized protein n=1 Tax=Nelumbo nucifera TaxID=4432 RepID=A0A822XDK8_NELNU|nr:TPA_asm: hypothetical protein HUJ06_020987 [Nelumbo nucifera]